MEGSIMSRHRGVLVVLWMVFVAGCWLQPDPVPGTPHEGQGQLEVTPQLLDYQQLNSGDMLTLPITLVNVGDGPLTITGLSIDGSEWFTVDIVEPPWSLEPYEAAEPPVTFAPGTDGDFEAVFRVQSDDPNAPEYSVEMFGVGLAPVLYVDPTAVEFDAVAGCEETADITLRNTGSAPLTVTEIDVSATSDEFLLVGDLEWPLILHPNQEETIQLSYTAWDMEDDTASLTFVSNDPLNPVITVAVTGTAALAATHVDQWVQGDPPTDRFYLSWPPVEPTLIVEVAGDPVTEGWWFDAAAREIVFEAENIPPPGTGIDARYNPAGPCD